MILDQVSKKQQEDEEKLAPSMQNAEKLRVHEKVTQAIDQLLENQLFNMAEMMLNEQESVKMLVTRTPLSSKQFSWLDDAKYLFPLTNEPFFRSLLQSIHMCLLSEFGLISFVTILS